MLEGEGYSDSTRKEKKRGLGTVYDDIYRRGGWGG